jgi:hypothetical protein
MWRERFHKFTALPPDRRSLLVRTLVLVWIVRTGLWVAPFPLVRRLTNRWARPRRPHAWSPAQVGEQVQSVTEAVTRASRFVPRATCLTQALATRILLARLGIESVVRYGAARSADGKFLAHAWVESAGRVVIGGVTSPDRYAPFPAFDTVAAEDDARQRELVALES